MENEQFYDFLIKVQSISKIGLLFSRDPYAVENYQQINQLSKEMLENFMDIKYDRPNHFIRDAYPTPNVSVRTVVFDESGRLLLVKESVEGAYSLPGGWCDLYDSPSEAAKAEVSQEAGLEVAIVRLVGVMNHTPFKSPAATPEYVLVFEAEKKSDFHDHTHETCDVGFFALDQLPPLSHKMTRPEFDRIIRACLAQECIFD